MYASDVGEDYKYINVQDHKQREFAISEFSPIVSGMAFAFVMS